MDTRWQPLILLLLLRLLSETQGTASPALHNRFRKCSRCPPGWGVSQTCTKTENTMCRQCATGKTYSSHHSLKSPCWLCSKCGIGLYEAHRCTPVKDTVCNECTSYIDHKNFTQLNDFTEKCSYLFLQK